MMAIQINGEGPATIEKVMMGHLLMTMAMADDDDISPIIIHYKRKE